PAQIKVETRTGESSQPDETWSAWKDAAFKDGAFAINSPAARYFQYKLTWKSSDNNNASPASIGRVEVSYLPRDMAPKISTVSVKPASNLSGKQNIDVTGTDSDNDNLSLNIEISSDAGKTWQTLAANLRP